MSTEREMLAAAIRENKSKRIALAYEATRTSDPTRRIRLVREVRRLGIRAAELGDQLREARS